MRGLINFESSQGTATIKSIKLVTSAGLIDVTRDVKAANEHYCEEMAAIDKREGDEDFSDSCFHGHAIGGIEYRAFGNSGRVGWVAHNEEYGTFINYCPFCGVKLEIPHA